MPLLRHVRGFRRGTIKQNPRCLIAAGVLNRQTEVLRSGDLSEDTFEQRFYFIFVDGVVCEPLIFFLRFLTGDESGGFQHLEMMRDIGLRDLQSIGQVAHAAAFFFPDADEFFQNPQSRRVCQYFQGFGEVLHGPVPLVWGLFLRWENIAQGETEGKGFVTRIPSV